MSYLDTHGLTTLWNKIKTYISNYHDTTKQNTLVSGTNIKTVNSNSLLGSGNVSVGTYSKPSTGIPKTDLASAVQTSLGKADTALQSADIYDGLDSTSATKALSANQGYQLKNGDARDNTKLPLAGGTMTGTTILPENKLGLHFRNNSSYHSGVMYQTAGNEALVFANKSSVTSYMFLNNVDPTTMTSSTWQSVIPAMQIKGNSVYIDKRIGNGVTPNYKLYTNGDVQLNGKVGIAEAVTIEYDSTNKCLNFNFT